MDDALLPVSQLPSRRAGIESDPEDFLKLVKLADLHARYLDMANRLEMFRLIGLDNAVVKQLECDCWIARMDAYRVLVSQLRSRCAGMKTIAYNAAQFGWSIDQLNNDSLRSLLCKDAADYSDPNPVEAEHVYLQMAKNFPPDAIGWVKRARWTGPIWIPWDRVDTDDRKKWAASHQPEKVDEFAKAIKAHDGHVAPSVLVQEPGSQKAFIVDGHHRALAREKLGQKVLAYLGNVDEKDRLAAEETHDRQIHQGSDPQNA